MLTQRITKLLLSVVVLSLVFVWIYFTPAGLLGKADAVGYAVCHQIPSHSYHLGERPLSLCARCSGQFLGMLLGLIFQGVLGWKKRGFPSGKKLIFLGILILLYLLDGINSFLTLYPTLESYALYPPQNLLRVITGTGMGITLSTILFPVTNQVLWVDPDPAPALEEISDWILLFGIGGLLALMIDTENPLLLFPLILLSTFGVIFLLTLAYMIIFVILFQRENTYSKIFELKWWGIAGFTAALLQIGLLDIIRYALTGTWSGF